MCVRVLIYIANFLSVYACEQTGIVLVLSLAFAAFGVSNLLSGGNPPPSASKAKAKAKAG